MTITGSSVTNVFLHWYQQLPSNDKQQLCDFLRQWLQPNSGRPPAPALRFGGRISGPANASTQGATPLTCPTCGTKVANN